MRFHFIPWLLAMSVVGSLALLRTSGHAQLKPPTKPIAPGGQIVNRMPRNVTVGIEFTSFQCIKADEFNGDEPYLIPYIFWLDGSSINLDSLKTSQVQFSKLTRLHGNLGHAPVTAGDNFAIPPDTGHFKKTIQPIVSKQGGRPAVTPLIGVILLGCEQDETSDSALAIGVDRITQGLSDAMNVAVRSQNSLSNATLSKIVEDNLGQKYVGLITKLDIFGLFNGDDFIGSAFQTLSLVGIEKAGPGGLPFVMQLGSDNARYLVRGIARVLSDESLHHVTLTIRRVQAIDSLEGPLQGEADFQVQATIGGKPFLSPEQTGNLIAPNWTFQADVSGDTVPISIELFERDGALSADEHCDINPTKGKRSLLLRYDVRTGKVTGDVSGADTGVFHVRGEGDDDRCAISFMVHHS